MVGFWPDEFSVDQFSMDQFSVDEFSANLKNRPTMIKYCTLDQQQV